MACLGLFQLGLIWEQGFDPSNAHSLSDRVNFSCRSIFGSLSPWVAITPWILHGKCIGKKSSKDAAATVGALCFRLLQCTMTGCERSSHTPESANLLQWSVLCGYHWYSVTYAVSLSGRCSLPPRHCPSM